jgi:hypothetical protein
MHEGSCDQDAGSEMPAEEKEVVRYWQVREAAGDDREGAC